MKSRTSFCNGPLLRRLAVKGLPLWGGYLVLWLVLMPMMLYNGEQYRELIDLRDHILSVAAEPSHAFGFFYGLISACFVFSWMYKSRSANFFGALPLDRATLFGTCYLTGLLFAVVPHLVTVLVSLPLAFVWGLVLIKDLAIWFVAMTAVYLFYYSLAAAVAMVVGNLVALPVLYGIVNFTAIVVESVVRELLSYFIYGLSFRGSYLFDWASPFYYVLAKGGSYSVTRIYDEVAAVATDIIFKGWLVIGILAAVGVAFAVLAFFLHKHRRMESAGDVIAVQHLKPVVLYCFTAGCSLVLGYFLTELLLSGSIGTEDFVGVTLCMLAGGFVGYFGGQMLLHKSMRVFRKRHWLNWAVVSVVMVALLLCARYDVFGYAHYIPETEDVEAASVGYGGDFNEDPAFVERVMELHQACLDRQFETERMDVHQDGYHRMYLSYKLKNGDLVERQYLLPISQELANDATSLIRMFEDLYNEPEYKVIRNLPRDYTLAEIERIEIVQEGTGETVWLAKEEFHDFLKNCLEPDLRESAMEQDCYCGYHNPDQRYTNIHVEVVFEVEILEKQVSTVSKSRYYFFTVTEDAARTLAYAAEKGVEPVYEKENK